MPVDPKEPKSSANEATFGKEAARYLASLVKGKTVSIIVRRFDDKYGRDIADLYVDDMWVVGHLGLKTGTRGITWHTPIPPKSWL